MRFVADLRYALRQMRRSPGFTAVAVLSLALGIGANTAIFSLIYTVMLRAMPVAHPEELVQIMDKWPGEARGLGSWAWQEYTHFRDSSRSFSALTGDSFNNLLRVRDAAGEPETRSAEYVTGNYFAMLGVQPSIGRLIGPADIAAKGDGSVAVLSWSYWNRRYRRDPAVLGRVLIIGGQAVTIVGVGPRGYTGPRVGTETDLWLPREHDRVAILARLKPGVTLAQARAEVAVLFRPLLAARSAGVTDARVRGYTVDVDSAAAGFVRVRDLYGKPLLLLMAVVSMLLLLACLNMSSLLLARGAARRREMAIRVALGAGGGRLIRQMLTESILLSTLGTLAGILLAWLTTGALARVLASGRVHERIVLRVDPDLRLVLFTAAIAVLTGVLFGLAPAWRAFRSAPASPLRQAGPAGETRLWRAFGRGLVAAQVALSILLVAAAGVFVAHVARLRHLDLGFRSDHVLVMTLDPERSGYTRAQLVAPYQQLLARLETNPAVRAASIVACTPIQGCGASRLVLAEGFTEAPRDRRYVGLNRVGPRYFETLGIPLLAGRDFAFSDANRSRVALISQSMAQRYFPGSDPIGKHVTIDPSPRTGGWDGDQPYEVIGVVGDAKYTELRDPPPPTMYLSTFQDRSLYHQFVIRTSIAPESLAADARRAVRELLPAVAVANITTLEDRIDAAIVPERLIATLSEFFGALAATLAGIGLYGLLAYSVSRRTNEIGVRVALGATAADVRRLVFSDTLRIVLGGLLAGAALIVWARPLAAKLLPDLAPPSPGPFLAAAAAVLAIALVASAVPARRASRIDPIDALRQE